MSQPNTDVLGWEARGEMEGSAIAEWLQSLPRPLAVFACNDVRGRQIIDACGQSGLSVPEEVAVIGVDDDEVICELSNPPLSSVQPDTLRFGYEGAALLGRDDAAVSRHLRTRFSFRPREFRIACRPRRRPWTIARWRLQCN